MLEALLLDWGTSVPGGAREKQDRLSNSCGEFVPNCQHLAQISVDRRQVQTIRVAVLQRQCSASGLLVFATACCRIGCVDFRRGFNYRSANRRQILSSSAGKRHLVPLRTRVSNPPLAQSAFLHRQPCIAANDLRAAQRILIFCDSNLPRDRT